MAKFETSLGTFLYEKTVSNFNLLERLDMALNLAKEVEKMSEFGIERTVHRDLKPTNIMLDAARSFILIDFGIGRTYDPVNDFPSWGSSGTPAFVAPEQLTCFKQNEKVDVWALGKVIALIIFEWSCGWHLLWTPIITPDEIRFLGPLVQFIHLLKDMIAVSYHYTYCSSSYILIHMEIFTLLIIIFRFKLNPDQRPNVQIVIEKIESVKSNFMSYPTVHAHVQDAWESLHTRINKWNISVSRNTMATRDLNEEVTLVDLNARSGPNIPDETGLHFQKMSNLCTQFAIMSAVRHEMKKIIKNSISTAVNMLNGFPTDKVSIPIPAGKLIDELFKENEFQFFNRSKIEIVDYPNALSFERMLSVLLGCVSPRSLSGLVKTLNIHFEIIIFFK